MLVVSGILGDCLEQPSCDPIAAITITAQSWIIIYPTTRAASATRKELVHQALLPGKPGSD